MRRTSGHNGLTRSGNGNVLHRGGENKHNMMNDGGRDTGRTGRTERQRKRKSV